MNAEGGWNEEGIRSLVGAPVFNYPTSSLDSKFWNTINSADKNNFIIGAHTGQGSNTYNLCNIPYSHAYSVIATFNLTLQGSTIQAIMVRNPWGIVKYNGSLSASD